MAGEGDRAAESQHTEVIVQSSRVVVRVAAGAADLTTQQTLDLINSGNFSIF